MEKIYEISTNRRTSFTGRKVWHEKYQWMKTERSFDYLHHGDISVSIIRNYMPPKSFNRIQCGNYRIRLSNAFQTSVSDEEIAKTG
jgi:hypothetical protein